MTHRLYSVILLCMSLLAPTVLQSGCGSATAQEGERVGDPSDWCGGHAVPESMCTLCHADLVAGFQTSGDWCAEHQLPESVCPQCGNGMTRPQRGRRIAPPPSEPAAPGEGTGSAAAVPSPADEQVEATPEREPPEVRERRVEARPPVATQPNPGESPGEVDDASAHAHEETEDGAPHGAPVRGVSATEPGPTGGAVAAGTGDWCAEHGVPEASCTLCHPSLRAAFIAAGDFCETHGLPLSICPGCGNGQSAPTAAALTPTLRSLAGVETTLAWGGAIELLAYSGVVETLPGDRLVLAARADGLVQAVLVAPGDPVRVGDVLVELESVDSQQLATQTDVAAATVTLLETTLARVRAEVDAGLAPAAAITEAESELAVAQAELTAARRNHRALGGDSGGRTLYRAVRDGIVASVDVQPGAGVGAGAQLVELRSGEARAVRFALPMELAAQLSPGVPLWFEPMGGARVGVTVERLAATVDSATGLREVWAVTEADLLPGTPGRVSADAVDCAAVPTTSILPTATGPQVLIVNAGAATPRPIELISQRGGTSCVSGVAAGEEVVTHGVITIAASIDPGSIADGCVDH